MTEYASADQYDEHGRKRTSWWPQDLPPAAEGYNAAEDLAFTRDELAEAESEAESARLDTLEAVAEHTRAAVRALLTRGGSFILDAPTDVPAIWGRGDQVLWAEDESLVLAGQPGVGKTTLAGQLVRGRLVGGEVLGLPVEPGRRATLYLAMDRPRQIARALRRTLGDLPRGVLDERLVVWQGPPAADIAKHPEVLLGLAQAADADTVALDSLKDAAVGLSEDDVGAGYNRARQLCLRAGIQVIELHHTIKKGANGARPTTLADLYGSTWIAAGAGSVVLLHGAAGDPIVELLHLKQPAAEVGPFKVLHDHDAGTSAVWHTTDLVLMAKARGAAGLTAKAAATAMFETDKPSAAQVEKARRKLASLAKGGQLTFTEGDRATSTAAVWTFTHPFTHPAEPVNHHDDHGPSRDPESEHEQTFTDTFTGITPGDLHAHTPPCKGGVKGPGTDDRPTCATCGKPMGKREAQAGVCHRCDRIAAAEAEWREVTP